MREYYEYNQTLKEIEIINNEIQKYEVENSKSGEWMSNKKKKSAKIINFINKSKENNKIQT